MHGNLDWKLHMKMFEGQTYLIYNRNQFKGSIYQQYNKTPKHQVKSTLHAKVIMQGYTPSISYRDNSLHDINMFTTK